MTTTFEKLGGEAAISLVVDKFYDGVLADPKTSHFFQGTDMVKQRHSQKTFITMALGGPNHYEGKDMKAAHAKFKITKTDLDNVWSHLDEALHFYKVAP
jgi:hemoglobin